MSKTIKKWTGKIFKAVGLANDTPQVSSESAEGLEDEASETAAQRRKLFETEGGAAGEELEEGGVSQRKTLLGN